MFNLLSIADISSAMVENLLKLGVYYYIILNAFGIIAVILKVVEYQFKNRTVILILALTATVLWVLYFFLQGDFVSSLINLIAIMQYLIFLQRGKRKWANSKLWLYFFILLQISLGLIFFIKWYDIFPILGGVFNVLCYFTINGKTYRKFAFICLLFWILNDVFKFYLVGFMNDFFGAVSVVIAIIRYDILKKTNKINKKQV